MAAAIKETSDSEPDDFFTDFADILLDPPKMRDVCRECGYVAYFDIYFFSVLMKIKHVHSNF